MKKFAFNVVFYYMKAQTLIIFFWFNFLSTKFDSRTTRKPCVFTKCFYHMVKDDNSLGQYQLLEH